MSNLLEFDNALATKFDQDQPGTTVVDYNPIVDLEMNTSYLVRLFLDCIAHTDFTFAGRVSLRNQMLLASQSHNYPFKPVGGYFLGMLVKHVNDKKKILQVLGNLGITSSYKRISNFEQGASEEFNKKYNKLPNNATIN